MSKHLTPFQKDVYFDQLLHHESTHYSLVSSIQLPNNIDVEQLKLAIKQVFTQLDMLNCVVDEEESSGALFFRSQQLLSQALWSQCELTNLAALEQLEKKLKNHVYDLKNDALAQVNFVSIDQERFLLLAGHHIIVDGHSFTQIIRLICEVYKTPDLICHYTIDDVIAYQDKLLQPHKVHASLEYWRNSGALEFSGVLGTSVDQVHQIEIRNEFYSKSDWDKYNNKAVDSKVSVYHLLLSAFAYTIKRVFGLEKFSIGNVTHNRGNAHAKALIGMMSSIFPVTFDMSNEDDIVTLAKNTASQLKKSYRYQKVPLSLLISETTERRKPFDILFNYQYLDANLKIADSPILSRIVSQDSTSVPLVFDVIELGGENPIEFRIRYDESVVPELLAHNIMKLFTLILDNTISGITTYDALTCVPGDMLSYSEGNNSTEQLALYPDVWSLCDAAFRTQTNEIALVSELKNYSYAELLVLVDNAAGLLLSRYSEQSQFGIHYTRGVGQIVSILACFKANMILVPMDPEQDQAKLTAIADTLPLAAVLSDTWQSSDISVVSFKELASFCAQNHVIEAAVQPRDSAFILFTSGTTNKPKAVDMSHQAIVALILGQKSHCTALERRATCLQFTSINFDVAMQEILTTFHSGGTLVCISEKERTSLDLLLNKIKSCKVAHLFLPNTVLQQLLAFSIEEQILLPDLRLIVTAGEALIVNTQTRTFFRQHTECQLVNHYGPTETHVATGFVLPKELKDWVNRPAIGSPLGYAKVAIINTAGEVAIKGLAGELVISGQGIANGYWGQADLTDEKFTIRQLLSSQPEYKVYVSGDICRYQGDNELYFVARNQQQIKVNGIRIDLNEIVSQVQAILLVDNVAVFQLPGSGTLVLVIEGVIEDERCAINTLASVLPAYMCPKQIKSIAQFPTTSNNKLDRQALLKLFNDDFALPSSASNVENIPLFDAISQCWAEVLGCSQVSKTSNFFDLGGHSISASRLAKMLARKVCAFFHLKHVFQTSTLIEQYELITCLIATTDQVENTGVASAQQAALFRYQQLHPSSCQYNMAGVYSLPEIIELASFKMAIDQTVLRHQALHNVFYEKQGKLCFKKNTDHTIWYTCNATELDTKVNKFFNQPFDLLTQSPVRVSIFSADGSHYFAIAFHHIAMDGESLVNFKQQVDLRYSELLSGNDSQPKTILSINSAVTSQFDRAGIAHWLARLSDMKGNVMLPGEYSLPGKQAAKTIDLNIFETLSQLQQLSETLNTSPSLLFEAVFALIVGKYYQHDVINIGVPVSLHPSHSEEASVGYFVNTLPVVYHLNEEQSLAQYFQAAKQSRQEDLAYSDIDTDLLMSRIEDTKQPGLFQIFVQWLEHDPLSFSVSGQDFELIASPDINRFDLSISFVAQKNKPYIQVDYDAMRYSAAYIEQVLSRTKHVIAQLGPEALNKKCSEIDFLLAEEKNCIHSQEIAVPSFSHVIERFWQVAGVEPTKTALVYFGEIYSYSWLMSQVKRLVTLLEQHSLQRGDRVIVAMDRAPLAIVCQLALWQKGLVYVPLLHSMPKARIQYIVRQVEPALVFHDDTWSFSEPHIELTQNLLLEYPEADVAHLIHNDVAYILFTSGSTGKPKGVCVQHDGLVSLLAGLLAKFSVDQHDVMPSFGDLTFGVSFVECLLPLMAGGTCHIIPRNLQTDVDKLIPQVNKCTLIHLIPSLARIIANNAEVSQLNRLRFIFVGGDALNCSLVDNLQQQFKWAKVVEFYGQTEGTVLSTYCHSSSMVNYQASDNIIGAALPHAKLWILDPQGNPVPFGVTGDLYISGAGIAKEYLNAPDQTAESFIYLTNLDQGQFLKTGDRAKFTVEGLVQYLGRSDFQINVNGFRIEPAEVEAALRLVTGSDICVVKWFDDMQVLVGFYLSSESDCGNISRKLTDILPAYMIPHRFVALDAFPLNQNNKVDRKVLTLPAHLIGNTELEGDCEEQKQLFLLWKDVFIQPVLTLQDSFFDTGAHSLKATEFVSGCNKLFSIQLTLKAFFELATVSRIYHYITEQKKILVPEVVISRTLNQTGPLSPAQLRIWLLHKFDANNPVYDKNLHLIFNDELNVNDLKSALISLTEQHVILRTIYPDSEYQKIVDFDPTSIQIAEFGSGIEEQKIGEVKAEFANFRFDLSVQIPFKVAILSDLKNKCIHLLLKTHHIATDGISMQILATDLVAIYQKKYSATPAIRYLDYSIWSKQQRATEEHSAFWKAYLEQAPLTHDLPLDRQRTNTQSTSQSSIKQYLKKSIMVKVLSDLKVTQFEFLLALFGYTINRFSNQNDVLIATPEHGRYQSELANVVGCFINTTITRLNLADEQSLAEYIVSSSLNTREALTRGAIGFEKIVDIVEPSRNIIAMPLAQLLFNFQSELGAELEISPGNQVLIQEFGEQHSPYDLSLHIIEKNDEVELTWQYSHALFHQDTVVQISEAFSYVFENFEKLMLCNVNTLSYPHNDITDLSPSRHWLAVVEEQLKIHSDLIVVKDANNNLTGRQLLNEVSHLSQRIEQYVTEGEVVAVQMGKSANNIIALLAIQVARCGYLPVDLALPADRQAYIVQDANAKLLLCEQSDNVVYPSLPSIHLGKHTDDNTYKGDWNLSESDSTSYVLYTSGSTGLPKGVEITHGALSNFLDASADRIELSRIDLLSVTTISFDISLLEMLLPLYQGGSVYIASAEQVQFGHQINALVSQHQCNLIQTTPSRWQSWLASGLAKLVGIKALSGGEALSVPLANALTQLTDHLLNCYGPTEATVWSMIAPVQPEQDEVYIQNSLKNYQHFVVNNHGAFQPEGAKGELVISGESLAKQYVNRSELTAEKFMNVEKGSRIYRTGDQVRQTVKDCFQFFGRFDDQVKIRGHRVELAEIEKVLELCPDVLNIAVKLFEEQLVCYFQLAPDSDLDLLKHQALIRLPQYMQPSIWQPLAQFPVTPAGKVDYQKLDKPALDIPDDIVEAEGDVEQQLYSFWKQIFTDRSFGTEQDFFELGGNSLLAVSLMNQINEHYELQLNVKTLFEAPNIAKLAKLICAISPELNNTEFEEEGFL